VTNFHQNLKSLSIFNKFQINLAASLFSEFLFRFQFESEKDPITKVVIHFKPYHQVFYIKFFDLQEVTFGAIQLRLGVQTHLSAPSLCHRVLHLSLSPAPHVSGLFFPYSTHVPPPHVPPTPCLCRCQVPDPPHITIILFLRLTQHASPFSPPTIAAYLELW
jgi:hypothetical protein